jgi:hypothetical protein
MDNTGFYESSFAVIMFLSFTSPILVYFLNCLINYSWMAKRPREATQWYVYSRQENTTPQPPVLNFSLDEPKQVKRHKKLNRPKRAEWKGESVNLNNPVRNKQNPSKSHVFVKNNQSKAVKVNFNTPKTQENTQKNKDLIKESVKSLKTLGYKSGEVKQTLQNLCISNQFKNSESLIEAFFKLGDRVG